MTDKNAIERVFNKPKVLLPVVHAISREQVTKNVADAIACGADGVFLINQGGMTAREVIDYADDLVREVPDMFVGVNILGREVPQVIRSLSEAVPGIWSDDAGVIDGDEPATEALWLLRRRARMETRWTGLFFGGVAFKYRSQVPVHRFGAVALAASQAGVNVVTTSGEATGSAPPIDKVRVMKEAIGNHALGLASGVTVENVESFLPYVDAFLVATGIEREFGWFDPVKLAELAKRIHQ